MLRLVAIVLTLLTLPAWAQEGPGAYTGSRKRFPSGDKRWALIVGLSEYENLPRSQWLLSGDKDARAIAGFLQSPRGGGLPSEHLKLLVNEQATTKNLRLALNFLVKNTKPGDVVTIFFAGHGRVESYGSGEIGYLLPYDSDPDVLNATALPMDEVRRFVDQHLGHASQVIMITDACHSGALETKPGTPSWKTASITEHLRAVGERDGVLNIMACRRDEVAVEDPRLGGHGVLTYALLKALNGSASATKRGIVRNQELLAYIMAQVPRLTDQEQHPRHSVNYTDEFPLANLNLEGPRYQPPEAPIDLLQSRGGQTIAGLRSGSAFSDKSEEVVLKIHGASQSGEVYLLQGNEQQSLGSPMMDRVVLVAKDLEPGEYTLIYRKDGKIQKWPLELRAGKQAFDVQSGSVR